MVNPPIYVLCIKQFWASVSIKKSNDVVKLQALIDKKYVIITENTIRQDLRLDDADGVDCLPNEEIFAELARMGYEKPSTKLTFYKAFFSAQWKFLIHAIVQCMSAKRTACNEFSSSMASAVICLATDDLSSHNTKYPSPALTQKVFANMRRIIKGFSEVETPLFDTMLVQPQVQDAAKVKEDEDDELSAAPTPPSPTPAPTSSPPQQESIPSHPQSQSAQPLSPIQQQPTQPTDNLKFSMTLLNTLMEICATLTQKISHLEQDKERMEEDVTAVKEVNAVEPTVFDDEEVTMTMAQTLIKMKAKKQRIIDEQMAKRLQDKEIEQADAREK
nr:hypothetical protein [Tanacetum cinerariifolium]